MSLSQVAFEEKTPPKVPSTLSEKAIYISEGNKYGNNWQIPPEDLSYREEATRCLYYSEVSPLKELKEPALLTVVTQQDSQNTAQAHTQEIKSDLGPLVMNAANAWHIGGSW